MSASDSSSPEACTVLYKILTEDEHAALYDSDPEAGTRWSGTSLDLNDGFIHTSTSAQVRRPLIDCRAPGSRARRKEDKG